MTDIWTWSADDPDLEAQREATKRSIKAQREAVINAHIEREALESIGMVKGLATEELAKAKNQARVNVALAQARHRAAEKYLESLPEPLDDDGREG